MDLYPQVVYSKKQVFKALQLIVGLKEREIGYWTELGIVIPSIANPQGRGFTRFYSFENLIEFGVAKRLVDAGLNLKATKSVMQKLREENFVAIYSLGRIRIVIKSPNDPNMEVEVEVINRSEANKCTLDMDEVETYFVIDVTNTVHLVRQCADTGR